MPVGAGLCPAGTCSAGYGVPDTAPAPNLTPLPDYRTGAPQGGRYIDQQTKDYVFTSDGRVEGMGNVAQMVLIAIQGADFSNVTEKGSNYVQQITSVIESALAYLVTSKQVLIKRVTVIDRQPNMNPDAGIGIVEWLDLTTGEPQETPY